MEYISQFNLNQLILNIIFHYTTQVYISLLSVPKLIYHNVNIICPLSYIDKLSQ